jgi:aryl-alcohol dehydrogenase-like predicted oxidoreductase
MNLRRLGSTDLLVSELGLGCARIGGIFQRDPSGFMDLLSAARHAGINVYDTADMYSQGESEELIGRAFRSCRDRVVLLTKAGYCLPAQRRLAARLKPVVSPLLHFFHVQRDRLPSAVRGALAQNFSPAYLRRAIEGSLRRLRTDRIDLFQLHSPPAEIVARGDWIEALEALKKQGKIRYYGVACDTVDSAVSAMRHRGVSAIQITVNLLERRAVDAVLPEARARRVGIVARECLANGLLVKDPATIDLGAYCRSAEERTLRAEQLAEYHRRAAASGCTLPELALDFVTRLDGVPVALIGARSVEQLEGLLAVSRCEGMRNRASATPRACISPKSNPS